MTLKRRYPYTTSLHDLTELKAGITILDVAAPVRTGLEQITAKLAALSEEANLDQQTAIEIEDLREKAVKLTQALAACATDYECEPRT